MQAIVDAFLTVWRALVAAGFSPVDIVLIFVVGALYNKAEALDKKLHECLDESVSQKQKREMDDIENRM